MGRTPRKGRQASRLRRARFERLEERHLLSVNQRITTDTGVQQMPSVAVDPLDPDHIVIAYMDYSLRATGYAGIGVAVSDDGGTSWKHSSVPLPDGFDQGAANPMVKFDKVDHDAVTPDIQNRAYISFMAATFLGEKPPITNPGGGAPRALGFQSNNGIFISYSDDGLSWQAPTAVTSHQYDGAHAVPFEINPDLAIDTNPASPYFGHIYATWARYYPAGQFPGEPNSTGGSQVMIAVSTDHSQTWTEQLEERPDTGTMETVLVDAFDTGLVGPGNAGAGSANNPHVTIGPEGDIYVSVFYLNGFRVYRSDNGGDSFALPSTTSPERGLPFGGVLAISPTPAGIPSLDFRVLVSRAIAADPTRPGTVYVAEAYDLDVDSKIYDEGDIVFSRSSDDGQTWNSTFQLGDNQSANFVNDDNDGERARLDHQEDDLFGPQIMPRLVADLEGNVALIWYDTRRDPANRQLDVFASISTDHGQTFSPNFRITSESFDTNRGRFTNAIGKTDFSYIGDAIGMALANDAMYAAWTDTRNGQQDIYFSRISLETIPDPPNDRFESNDVAASATQLGSVIVEPLPRLTLADGDEDWFQFKSLATGQISISALSDDAAMLQLELWDPINKKVVGTSTELRDASGNIIGKQITAPGATDNIYQLRVFRMSGAGSARGDIEYRVDIESLTENLGQIAHQSVDGSLEVRDHAYYLLQSAAVGEIDVRLTLPPDFDGEPAVEFLDPRTYKVLPSHNEGGRDIRLGVEKGQSVLVHVTGGRGGFELDITNFDQFSLANLGESTLFFPAGKGPSEVAVGDLNNDHFPDLVVSSALTNVVNVLIGNGDGTFQAPRQYSIGAFTQLEVKDPLFGRALAIADFDNDGEMDVIVTNNSSSDVSVLLGRGDGTFNPQRRFDATPGPFALAVGDVNGDALPDAVVVDSVAKGQGKVAVLLGKKDTSGWRFQPPTFFDSPLTDDFSTARVKIVDLNHDGKNDLVLSSDFDSTTHIVLGNGDGTFRPGSEYTSFGSGLAVADLNGDDFPDVVNAQLAALDQISYVLNKGDGTGAFEDPQKATVGVSPVGVAVTDFDGDTIPDLIVANSGITQPLISGPPTIMLLRGLINDGTGQFDGFAEKETLATLKYPHDLQVADLNGDGKPEIVVVDRDGIVIIFGTPPSIEQNNSPESARDFGTVVHIVEPTLTIVPGHNDAYYKLKVPTEAFQGAGDQVLDFSGGFANEDRNDALVMEVVDRDGNLLGSGERFRIVVPQKANSVTATELFVHIFGQADNEGRTGSGAYTLIINTLPQLADIEAHHLLPGIGNQAGGPTTSLSLVFQGDRLDPSTAEKPSNYKVIWLGPDGIRRTADDREIAVGVGLPANAKVAVYDASSNVDVSSSRDSVRYPTAVRQTVTLLFSEPLPAGSYEIEVSRDVVTAAFNSDEAGLLSSLAGFTGHAIVSVDGSNIQEGEKRKAQNLVHTVGPLGSFEVFEDGTRTLTQLHNDLSYFLDAQLTAFSDRDFITDAVLAQIIDRMSPALGPAGQRIASMAVFFLDPVSIGLVDPDGQSLNYDLQTRLISNNLPKTFVEVGGNVEVIVIPNPSGIYRLNVADVPGRARGGMVYFSNLTSLVNSFTDELRSGAISFSFDFGSRSAPGSDSGTRVPPGSDSGTRVPPGSDSGTRVPPGSDSGTRVVPAFLATTSASFASVSRTTFGIQSPISAAKSSALSILTLLTLLSGTSTDSGASADADSDGGRSQSGSSPDALQSAWESLSNLLIGPDEKSKEAGSDKSKSGSPLLRAWHVIDDILDDIFGPPEDDAPLGPNAIQHETAKQDSQQPNSESSKDQSTTPTDKRETGEATTENNSKLDQNTSDAGRQTDPAAQSTEASSPQPNLPAASKEADGNDSYATSA